MIRFTRRHSLEHELLGVGVAGEQFGPNAIYGMAAIVTSVALIAVTRGQPNTR